MDWHKQQKYENKCYSLPKARRKPKIPGEYAEIYNEKLNKLIPLPIILYERNHYLS